MERRERSVRFDSEDAPDTRIPGRTRQPSVSPYSLRHALESLPLADPWPRPAVVKTPSRTDFEDLSLDGEGREERGLIRGSVQASVGAFEQVPHRCAIVA